MVLGGKVIVDDDSLLELYADQSFDISTDEINETGNLHADIAATSLDTGHVYRPDHSERNA
jgi:hypothetical protein